MDPVKVEVPCNCPTKHERDTVFLRPALTASMGAAGLYLIRNVDVTSPSPAADLEGQLGAMFLRLGIVDWTKTADVDGVEVKAPISAASIDERLPWADGGKAVLEKASELYSEDLMRPLVAAKPSLLRPGRTGRSTSRKSRSGRTRPERSKPSSPTGSAGAKSEP